MHAKELHGMGAHLLLCCRCWAEEHVLHVGDGPANHSAQGRLWTDAAVLLETLLLSLGRPQGEGLEIHGPLAPEVRRIVPLLRDARIIRRNLRVRCPFREGRLPRCGGSPSLGDRRNAGRGVERQGRMAQPWSRQLPQERNIRAGDLG